MLGKNKVNIPQMAVANNGDDLPYGKIRNKSPNEPTQDPFRKTKNISTSYWENDQLAEIFQISEASTVG